MVEHAPVVTPIRNRSGASAAALAAALDLVAEGVLLVDANLEIRAANARAAELLASSTLRGRSLAELLPPNAAAQVRAGAHAVTATSATRVSCEVEFAATDSSRLEITLHATPADAAGTFIAILRPLNGAAAMPGAASSGDRDYLTGLPTRAALATRLQEVDARARRDRSQYAILFVDLDSFKQLNDAWGHTAGDRVLAIVAERLQAAVRPGDLVVRYGGDEFVIVVNEIAPRQLARLARRIRTTLAAPLEIAGQWMPVSASIGRALGDAGCSAGKVLDEADRAMYRAKAARCKRRSG